MSETSESKAQSTENLVDKMEISQEIEAKLKKSVALLIPINIASPGALYSWTKYEMWFSKDLE